MTCAKVSVTATLTTTAGETFVGTNDCDYPQPICPRKPGEGYEKCSSICGQRHHAEVGALLAAGPERAAGGTMHVNYHYACEPCQAACAAFGIKEIICG